MPVLQRDKKWYWGSKGPFDSRKKAEKVAQAAHASGYVAKFLAFTKAEEGIKGIKGIEDLTGRMRRGGRPKDDVPKEFREYATPEEIKRLGLRPQTGVDEGTFYDTRDLEAGQYAAATGEKHTIEELEEAGKKGAITLDDLGMKLEDTPFSFRHHKDSPEKVDLNRKNKSDWQTPISSKEVDLLATVETHPAYSSGKARGWASSMERNRNPFYPHGELDSSKHKYFEDWLKQTGASEDGLAVRKKEFERLLGREPGDRELTSDVATALRVSSERMVAEAKKQLKQIDKIKDEIKAFKIQRGIDRIGLKRGGDVDLDEKLSHDPTIKDPDVFSPQGQVQTGEKVQRYWYHHRLEHVPIPEDGGVNATRIRQTQAADGFRGNYAEGEYIWLSPQVIRGQKPEDSLLIDISELSNNDIRFTGQAEGNILHRGKIPKSAFVDHPPRPKAEDEGNEVEKLFDFIKAEGDNSLSNLLDFVIVEKAPFGFEPYGKD